LEFGSVGFYGGKKTGGHGEKPWSKERTNNKLNPLADHWNQTWITEVGGERSRHYAKLVDFPLKWKQSTKKR